MSSSEDEDDDASEEGHVLSWEERRHLSQERRQASAPPLIERSRLPRRPKPKAKPTVKSTTFLGKAEFAKAVAAGKGLVPARVPTQHEKPAHPLGFASQIGRAFWDSTTPALRAAILADGVRSPLNNKSSGRGRQPFDVWASSTFSLPDEPDCSSDDASSSVSAALPSIPGDLASTGRKRGARRAVYVLPLECDPSNGTRGPGDATDALAPRVESILRYLSAYFHGLPVKLLPAISQVGLGGQQPAPVVGKRAVPPILTQLNLSKISAKAHEMLPEDGYCCVVLSSYDVYTPPREKYPPNRKDVRVSVISWALLHPKFYVTVPPLHPEGKAEEEAQRRKQSEILWQVCSNMSHEILHLMNVQHCCDFHCRMNADNSSVESPGAPDLCGLCFAKLSVALSPRYFNVLGRFHALREICLAISTEAHACPQWSRDAEWFEQMIAACPKEDNGASGRRATASRDEGGRSIPAPAVPNDEPLLNDGEEKKANGDKDQHINVDAALSVESSNNGRRRGVGFSTESVIKPHPPKALRGGKRAPFSATHRPQPDVPLRIPSGTKKEFRKRQEPITIATRTAAAAAAATNNTEIMRLLLESGLTLDEVKQLQDEEPPATRSNDDRVKSEKSKRPQAKINVQYAKQKKKMPISVRSSTKDPLQRAKR